jgi:hypothetical protein
MHELASLTAHVVRPEHARFVVIWRCLTHREQGRFHHLAC